MKNNDSFLLKNIINIAKPDAIFEINGTRGQCNFDFPKSIKHIAWLQDYRTNSGVGLSHYMDKNFGGSDLIYLLSDINDYSLSYDNDKNAKWDILPFGVDEDFYYPKSNLAFERNLAMCGFIPPEISNNYREVKFIMKDHRYVKNNDIINTLELECLKNPLLSSMEVKFIIKKYVESTFNEKYDDSNFIEFLNNHPSMHWYDTELPRMIQRKKSLIEL